MGEREDGLLDVGIFVRRQEGNYTILSCPCPSLSLLPSFLLSARHSWTCQALAYKQLPWSALSALPPIRVVETKVALFVTHEVIIQDAAMHIQVATLFWNETLRFL